MSGYKRVNFYELCRLCATNQQKDKTHIFQEEGRKIQLQTKIQSCLSLTVCENDFLPKVVCSKCLRTLEVCYTFRQECVSSESMLSSYFKNFRYTDDFKKSGKVYIKDTTTMGVATTTTTTSTTTIQKATIPQYQINSDNLNIPTITTSTTQTTSSSSSSQTTNSTTTIEHLPFYTLQIPTAIVATTTTTTTIKNESKIIQTNPTTLTTQTTNSLGHNQPITSTITKTKNDGLSNVVVNANGEVLHIAQLVDFETIINQSNIPKIKNNNNNNNKRKLKENIDEPVVKIDLTNSDIENSFDNKTANIHNNNNNNNKSKYGYTIKMEDNNSKTPIILNHLHEFHQNFNGYSATIYPSNITTTTIEPSTVNLNVLNSDFIKVPTTTTTVVPTVTTKESLKHNQQQQQQQQIIKMHICEICQKSFKRREHLYQHVKLHTGFRPYTCENCNKSFMRKEHLLRHMTSHSGLKNFTCNICDKSFSRNDNLLKHKKTHDKQNNYICEICQKQFVMKHYYLAHKLTHDNTNNSNNNNNNNNTTTTATSHIWNVVKT